MKPISKTNWAGTGVEPDVRLPGGRGIATAAEARYRKTELEINSEFRK
jgi:hypothetical protein